MARKAVHTNALSDIRHSHTQSPYEVEAFGEPGLDEIARVDF
jgi:hypothetical protein